MGRAWAEKDPHRSAPNVVLLVGVLALHRDAVSDNVHRSGARPGLRRRAAGGARPQPDAQSESNAEPEPVAESLAHHPTAYTLTSRRRWFAGTATGLFGVPI